MFTPSHIDSVLQAHEAVADGRPRAFSADQSTAMKCRTEGCEAVLPRSSSPALPAAVRKHQAEALASLLKPG